MKKVCLFVLLVLFPLSVYSQTVPNYLIDADIGQYSRSYPGACPKGSGVLAGAGHFKIDHTDYACDIRYYNEAIDLGVEVQVTQHTGGDSDKWLLHELEDSYRSNDQSRPGLLSRGAVIKRLVSGGDRIFSIRMGGGTYAWISNNVVIVITYRAFQGNQPEPREVIQAYLQKFPSTIPTTLALDQAHDIQWIKDEMDRRLWLCDKWSAQLQAGTVQQKDAFQAEVKSMGVFLDYREKYYGIAATTEKNLLAGYLNTNDSTNIQAKLAEYKTWWNEHKNDSITVP
jgi:hypothetical protein